jgi:hypothetical protein
MNALQELEYGEALVDRRLRDLLVASADCDGDEVTGAPVEAARHRRRNCRTTARCWSCESSKR